MEARLRPHTTDNNGRIINTLLENRKRGLSEHSLRSISYSLRQISKHVDLNNPESVKEHIANMKVSNSTIGMDNEKHLKFELEKGV